MITYNSPVILKIDGLEQLDETTATVPFAIDISRLAGLSETSNIYELSECQAELKLLKALSVRGIQNLFDDVDSDKLCYLLQVINQPVITNEVQEYEKDGKTRQAYKKHVNMKKVELLKEFEVVTPTKLRAPKNSRVKEDIPVVEATLKPVEDMPKPAEDMPKPVEDIKPVMPVSGVAPRAELPFRFAEMSKLCEVIQKRLDDASPLSQDDEQRMRNISTLMRVFGLFTVEGLTEYLKRYIDGDITYAMKKFRKE